MCWLDFRYQPLTSSCSESIRIGIIFKIIEITGVLTMSADSKIGSYTMMAVGVIGTIVSLIAGNLITAVGSILLAEVGTFSLAVE
jgi:hypothetical protein